jgi:hypothetical protein
VGHVGGGSSSPRTCCPSGQIARPGIRQILMQNTHPSCVPGTSWSGGYIPHVFVIRQPETHNPVITSSIPLHIYLIPQCK